MNKIVAAALAAVIGTAIRAHAVDPDYTYREAMRTAYGSATGAVLASGKVLIGNAANVAAAQTPTGDWTIDTNGQATVRSAAGHFVVGTNAVVTGALTAASVSATGTVQGVQLRVAASTNYLAILSDTQLVFICGSATHRTTNLVVGDMTQSRTANW